MPNRSSRRVARSPQWLANHRQLVAYIGAPAFVLGMIAVAPGWWWELIRTMSGAAGSNWIATICFGLAIATSLVAVGRWWWPWRRERPSTWTPITSRLPLLLHVVILVSLSVAVFVGIASIGWQLTGQPDPFPTGSRAASPPTATPQVSIGWTIANTLDAIKILLAVVAGIGGIVALTISYRKQDLGEAAEYREDAKLFEERFGRAADQVGAEQAAVRIAGVYSLARLADEWRDGRQTCIDVLCAYLRMSSAQIDPESSAEEARKPRRWRLGRTTPKLEERGSKAEDESDEHVRQTIVRLIRGHLLPSATHSWQGHIFDLTGAVLRGADFSEIEVQQTTELNLAGVTLSGLINFRGMRLSGGMIDFISAKSRKAFINFPDASLEAGTLDFYGMEFTEGTNLTFVQSRFIGATIRFNSNSFSGGRVSLEGADFRLGLVAFSMPLSWRVPPLLPQPLPDIVHLPLQYRNGGL